MTPHEMVAALDDAIAHAPRGRRKIALELRAPGGAVLGVYGKYLGRDPVDGVPVYGFTRRQCEQVRAIILTAAAEDAAAIGDEGG